MTRHLYSISVQLQGTNLPLLRASIEEGKLPSPTETLRRRTDGTLFLIWSIVERQEETRERSGIWFRTNCAMWIRLRVLGFQTVNEKFERDTCDTLNDLSSKHNFKFRELASAFGGDSLIFDPEGQIWRPAAS